MMQNSGKKSFRCQAVILILFLLLAAAVIWNIKAGSVPISTKDIVRIIGGRIMDNSEESNIIWKIRLHRILLAALLGGALAVSGFLLQTFFRNPIASPFVLGISSGAKMTVGFVMLIALQHISRVSSSLLVAAAFAGSLLVTGLVLVFSQRVHSMSMLLVIGIMVGYICSAVTDFFITFAEAADVAHLTSWSMGSFSGANWENVKFSAVICLTGLVAAFFLSKPMGAYQLGEGYAQSMGINIKLFRALLIVLSSLLSSCVTAFAGPISFVGIAVPHITKTLLRTSRPIWVIPVSYLGGAVFCLYCDLIARTVFAPTEMAIGTVTSIFGAPVVIAMMIRRKK